MQIFDFNKNCDISAWEITDDTVMGGKSVGQFILDANGNGVFKGEVSLENNGGFSSVKYKFEPKNIEGCTAITLKLKGDGKTYQFRVKPESNQRHSYNCEFVTNGHWQVLKIPITELYPIFRGKKLDLPNYKGQVISEITFLIANKREQSFELQLAYIGLE